MLKLTNVSSFSKLCPFTKVNRSFSSVSFHTRFPYSNGYRCNSGISSEEKKEQFNGDIPIEDLKIKFSRSPGPGGQNVNKVNTKVDVRFHVESAQWIPLWIKEKLSQMEGNRINTEGEFVIQSSKYRNQKKNLEDGVEKMRDILKKVSYIPKETSQEKKQKISQMMKVANERRLHEKHMRSQRKQERYK